MNLNRRRFNLSLVSAAALPLLCWSKRAEAVGSGAMTVYKSPYCGCCDAWVHHLRESGFNVVVTDMDDVTPVKRHYRIPTRLHSCHTAVVAGYVIEGHVPAEDIMRLILEAPSGTGLAVPGMPIGSPGMEQGDRKDPFEVLLFGARGISVFSRHNGA